MIGNEAAAFAVLFNDLYIDVLIVEHGCQGAACPAGADNHDPFDLFCAAGDEVGAEFFNGFGIANEIGIIMRQETIIAMRDDHAVIPEDHAGQNRFWHFQIF